MEYKTLETLYHMDSSPLRESNAVKLLEERKNASSSFRLGIETPYGELFIATPRELTILLEKVLRRERKVSNLMRALPNIAGAQVLRSMVFDEVVGSNAIENVHSTRKQIEEALFSRADDPKQKRFREFARLYLDLIVDSHLVPETPDDIRFIYDKVMDSEELDSPPDGRLFRRESVKITDGIKVIHEGVYSEEEITKAMQKMLDLVASYEIPSIYSALAAHFIFEYVHPFYDGNGRTGRYLLSLFLEHSLSKATALSLSRALAENRAAYYGAFSVAEHPLNRGELTFFIYEMLQLILNAQDNLIAKYEENIKTLDSLTEALNALESRGAYSGKELNLLFAMMQYAAFGVSGSASLEELANHLGLGKQQTRKYLTDMENRGSVKRTRLRNPIMFALTDNFMKQLADEQID